jgi:hypothetical protein
VSSTSSIKVASVTKKRPEVSQGTRAGFERSGGKLGESIIPRPRLQRNVLKALPDFINDSTPPRVSCR